MELLRSGLTISQGQIWACITLLGPGMGIEIQPVLLWLAPPLLGPIHHLVCLPPPKNAPFPPTFCSPTTFSYPLLLPDWASTNLPSLGQNPVPASQCKSVCSSSQFLSSCISVLHTFAIHKSQCKRLELALRRVWMFCPCVKLMGFFFLRSNCTFSNKRGKKTTFAAFVILIICALGRCQICLHLT